VRDVEMHGDQRVLNPLARIRDAIISTRITHLLMSSSRPPAPADSSACQAMPGAQRRWPGREVAAGSPRLATRQRAHRTPSYERHKPTSLVFMPHLRYRRIGYASGAGAGN
jgi:hypothetical protein